MPRPNMLNVRKHLDFVQLTIELVQKYGTAAPIVTDALKELSFLNRAIMRKHDAKKANTGSRKDLYVERSK